MKPMEPPNYIRRHPLERSSPAAALNPTWRQHWICNCGVPAPQTRPPNTAWLPPPIYRTDMYMAQGGFPLAIPG